MTRDEALRWIAELFEESGENLQPETSRGAVPAWDSLGVLTLIAGLDERFGIAVDDEELRAMETVDDILAVLRRAGELT